MLGKGLWGEALGMESGCRYGTWLVARMAGERGLGHQENMTAIS